MLLVDILNDIVNVLPLLDEGQKNKFKERIAALDPEYVAPVEPTPVIENVPLPDATPETIVNSIPANINPPHSEGEPEAVEADSNDSESGKDRGFTQTGSIVTPVDPANGTEAVPANESLQGQ